MVEKEMTVDFDDLIRQMPLEERLYRFRCVEAWSMAVPWSGFPMKALVDFAKPLSGAKYVVMKTAEQKDTMPGLKQFWYPWPYLEGLTVEEATNELAFIATGMYGKRSATEQAPLRLAVPCRPVKDEQQSLYLYRYSRLAVGKRSLSGSTAFGRM